MQLGQTFTEILGTLAVAALVVGIAMPGKANADEATLTLKGGGFTIKGDLKGLHQGRYIILSKEFGSMELDATRFDCVGSGCQKWPPTAALPAAPTHLSVPATPAVIRIHGSNALGVELMPTLIRAYAESVGANVSKIVGETLYEERYRLADAEGRPFGTIDLSRKGSSTAFRSLEAGKAEIGMATRRIRDAEVATLTAAGAPNMRSPGSEHVVALDGLMILVAPENTAVALSIDNIAKIFSGQITDWSSLRLPPGKIKVYSTDNDSGTLATFENLVLKPRELQFTSDVERMISHDERSDAVARDPLAITFAPLNSQRNAKALNIESHCGLIVRPSRFSIKTEEYALARRLYFYTKGTPDTPLARGLLEYALSSHAQETISHAQFVNQAAETLKFKDQGGRIAYALNAPAEDFDIDMMRKLISDVSQAERLSITFRFETASSTLDSKAHEDVQRLVKWLNLPENKAKKVMLLGFADSVGPFAANETLSTKRALAVRAAIGDADASLGNKTFSLRGYSELAPVSCNDTIESRLFNRRVEVWFSG